MSTVAPRPILVGLAIGTVLGAGIATALGSLGGEVRGRETELDLALRDPAVRAELVERLAAQQEGEMDSHPDALVGHVNLPGTHARPTGDLHVNAFGIRERDYALPRPPGLVRVVLLGDSFVFGWHVAEEQRLGVGLESALRERRRAGGEIEVLHVAVTSWNLVGECAFVRRQLDALAPDLVVQVTLPNDLDDTTGARGFGGMANLVPRYPEHADNVLRMYSALEVLGVPGANALLTGVGYESAARFREARDAILELLEAGRRLPTPPRYLLVANWGRSSSALHANLGTFLPDGAVFYLPERFREDPALRLSPGDPHWNPAGHARMAEVLYGLIRERGLLPQLDLAPWPEAERLAADLGAEGWIEAQGYPRLVQGTLRDLQSWIATASIDERAARQVLIGLDREGLVAPYASLVLGRDRRQERLRLRGRALPDAGLEGARVRVLVEEHELGEFELHTDQLVDEVWTLPAALAEHPAVGVRLQADDFVYRGPSLRHCVTFQLERLALE